VPEPGSEPTKGLLTLGDAPPSLLTVPMQVGRSQRGRLTVRGVSLLAVTVTVAATLVTACGGPGTGAQGKPVVLVVGDSLVAAAASDLTGLAPPRASTVVLAGIGASPCDLWAGYRASALFGGGYLSFRAAISSERPTAVVLAFTGNPGLSAHACVREPATAYSLSEILSAYRQSLSAMGAFAAGRGVRVFLSASPARNPDVPEGWVDSKQQGYNGDPAFNTMMSRLASSHGWQYTTDAAAAISGPGLGWTMYLPCQPATDMNCIGGHEQVRYGGSDAIHCDAPGSNGIGTPSDGSLRFARGLLTAPLAAVGLRPLEQTPSSSTTAAANRCSTSTSTTRRR
jgi:hypothetical protein